MDERMRRRAIECRENGGKLPRMQVRCCAFVHLQLRARLPSLPTCGAQRERCWSPHMAATDVSPSPCVWSSSTRLLRARGDGPNLTISPQVSRQSFTWRPAPSLWLASWLAGWPPLASPGSPVCRLSLLVVPELVPHSWPHSRCRIPAPLLLTRSLALRHDVCCRRWLCRKRRCTSCTARRQNPHPSSTSRARARYRDTPTARQSASDLAGRSPTNGATRASQSSEATASVRRQAPPPHWPPLGMTAWPYVRTVRVCVCIVGRSVAGLG